MSGVHAIATFQGSMYDRGRVSLFCASEWLHIMNSLRGLELFGPRLLPVIYAVRGTFGFMVIVMCCFGSAVHAYYMVGARDMPSPFYASFLQIVRLGLVGDFDLQEFEGVDTVFRVGRGGAWEPEDPEPSPRYVLGHLIFWCVTTVITVILMNLLIGILGSNYDLYEDKSRELFLRERADLICLYWERANGWPNIFGQRVASCLRRKTKVKPGDKEYLWFAVRQDVSQESTKSLRSFMAHQLKDLEVKQDAQFNELKAQLSSLRSCLNAKLCH